MREREINLHHHEFTRASWTQSKVNKLIREHPLSKSLMLMEIHTDLHRHIEPVKAPMTREDSEMMLRALRNLPSYYTPLDGAKAMSDKLHDTPLEYVGEHLNRQIPFLELSKEALRRRVV